MISLKKIVLELCSTKGLCTAFVSVFLVASDFFCSIIFGTSAIRHEKLHLHLQIGQEQDLGNEVNGYLLAPAFPEPPSSTTPFVSE